MGLVAEKVDPPQWFRGSGGHRLKVRRSFADKELSNLEAAHDTTEPTPSLSPVSGYGGK
jgi:hypothetical protein